MPANSVIIIGSESVSMTVYEHRKTSQICVLSFVPDDTEVQLYNSLTGESSPTISVGELRKAMALVQERRQFADAVEDLNAR